VHGFLGMRRKLSDSLCSIGGKLRGNSVVEWVNRLFLRSQLVRFLKSHLLVLEVEL